ncbi:hypothetical protein, partial [Streptomyces lavendulae]|uniref:hypothetical protein n=1 Tax=Streptomyces lavendulae TaxID=1914 RepID=UPI0031E80987
MAGEGVDQVLESARLRIGQLELLVDHAKSVERVHADDRRELARNLIRVLTDIAIDADEMAAL